MTLSEILDHIEGNWFSAYINAASSLSIFQAALKDYKTIQELIDNLRQYPEYGTEVYQRLHALLKANDQPEYMHPYDAAIAAYLYALHQVDSDLTPPAVQAIVQTPQLWWARRLAQQLQEAQTQPEKR